MDNRSTNLQITRFAAAMFVIFSHSFNITQGTNAHEWLCLITKGQISFGGLAVSVFFLMGGYLTAKSMAHYDGLINYIFKRLGRLLPALMFVVVSCVFIGAFISTLSISEYFSNIMTYRYLLNGILIIQHDLPGVFGGATYKSTVNGALWTMPVEFLCNIACCVAFKMGFLKKEKFVYTLPIVLVGSIAIYIIGSNISIIRAVIRPGILFYEGIGYWVYQDKIKYYKKYAWIALMMLVMSSMLGILNVGMVLFFAYIMMTFWFGCKQHFGKSSFLGEYAYSIYLWGFPVQQFIAERFDWNMKYYYNSLISSLICFVLAVFTYHFIEKPIGKAWMGKLKTL